MPPLFQGTCSACGYEPPPVSPGGPCLLVTDAAEDRRRRIGEHVPVVLHPLTPYVLNEFGLSFALAAWGGRLVEARRLVCPDCGRVYERRWLTAGGVPVGCGGCLGIAVFAGAAAAAAGVAARNPFAGLAIGGAAGAGLLAAAELGASVIVRWWYPERAAAVRTPAECPDCGGRPGIRVNKLRKTVPCPQCGSKTMRYFAAGPA
jgi:hypothetical protein